ncbi:MAG: hypothetical protein A3A51_04150 [Candidatus Levybacteria bacterium RIFCSPLOWO2_01_FULL_39_10]|nr:MAG: hypothetical protein A3A51_04150 [Candidatus Levybacteria bacterium RIFCSPLOWO2_01_FULL_39_10]
MDNKIRSILFAVLFFVLLFPFKSYATDDTFTVTGLTMDHTTGYYSFYYSGYTGGDISRESVAIFGTGWGYNDEPASCTGGSSGAGTCSGIFNYSNGTFSCTPTLNVSIYGYNPSSPTFNYAFNPDPSCSANPTPTPTSVPVSVDSCTVAMSPVPFINQPEFYSGILSITNDSNSEDIKDITIAIYPNSNISYLTNQGWSVVDTGQGGHYFVRLHTDTNPITPDTTQNFALNYATSNADMLTVQMGNTGPDSTQVCGLANIYFSSFSVAPTPANVLPVVGTITTSVNPVQIGTQTTATANFSDGNSTDTHTAIFDWGDGSTSNGTIIESNGSGSVSGSHVYQVAGVYEVTLTVTDNNNASDSEVFQYISAYNPTPQGLFTGVRMFNSPLGAVPNQPTLTGQVKFGVTTKYDNQNLPTGKVSMNFSAANIEFEASTITVLVTSNGKATLRGTGTINETGNYTFLITGLDSSTDKIRFQIKDDTAVIYDSQPGAADTIDPTTSITAGQIIVQ